MSVDKEGVVDAIGVDKDTNEVVLTISDHLPWVGDHLQQLQAKLNTYLGFIESGELLDTYPESDGRSVRIDVVLLHRPSVQGLAFLETARAAVQQGGFALSWRIHAP